jgi:hypothetical protein
MRLPLGHYAPDLQSIVNNRGLIQAKNMFPKRGGYEPMRALSPLDFTGVLPSRPRGAISGKNALGTAHLYAGTSDSLRVRENFGMTNVSKSGGYALAPPDRWSFAQFGNRIFAATLSSTIQYQDIGSGSLFQDVPTFAPRAKHIATIGNFVMSGNLIDPEGGTLPASVRWCAVDNPLNWPAFGSDAAVSVQADRVPLEGNGGDVQDIVSGAEVGVVFQERAIHRFDYRGGSTIFEKNRVEEGNGMLIPHSAVAFQRNVFYIAEDGFRVFDYQTSHPIGKDKTSRTFFADLDVEYLDRVETARDPERTLIWIAYPGSGHTGGRPNKLILYDYALDQFSHAEYDIEGLITNSTSSTLLSIDLAASPDDPDDVDGVSTIDSYDFANARSGISRMGAFDTSFQASDFSGDFVEGLIETGDLEGAPGNYYWMDSVRPIVDGRQPELSLAERGRLDERVVFGGYFPVDEDGEFSLRSDARYHRLRLKMLPGWTDSAGMDIKGVPSGER